jgi:hypothetical protein
MMPRDSEADLDEDTLPEIEFPDEPDDDRHAPARDVRIADFKDVHSQVTVSHGPRDPSRVWLMFESDDAVIHLSVEEGIARQVFERLAEILPRFHEVRWRGDPVEPRR